MDLDNSIIYSIASVKIGIMFSGMFSGTETKSPESASKSGLNFLKMNKGLKMSDILKNFRVTE